MYFTTTPTDKQTNVFHLECLLTFLHQTSITEKPRVVHRPEHKAGTGTCREDPNMIDVNFRRKGGFWVRVGVGTPRPDVRCSSSFTFPCVAGRPEANVLRLHLRSSCYEMASVLIPFPLSGSPSPLHLLPLSLLDVTPSSLTPHLRETAQAWTRWASSPVPRSSRPHRKWGLFQSMTLLTAMKAKGRVCLFVSSQFSVGKT